MNDQKQQIPKIIHYCWFGSNPIPKMLKYCIDTWKKHLPDYEIILWNETNSDFDCDFVQGALSQKKWAFVSDYIRLKAIYDYGGIYLDTDMLIIKSLDGFLINQCFFCADNNRSIGMGIFGAKKNHSFIYSILEHYRSLAGIESDFRPNTITVRDIFIKKYGTINFFDETITLRELSIYSPEYFYPLPFQDLQYIHSYTKYLTNKSYGVHLWSGSWNTYNERFLLRRKEYLNAIRKICKTVFIEKTISYTYVKKIMVAFRDSLMTKNAFR